MPDQGGWDPEPSPAQPLPDSGWDDESPPHISAAADRGRGKGRSSSSRGRASPVAQRRPDSAVEGQAESTSDSSVLPEHDGWGDALPSDAPGNASSCSMLMVMLKGTVHTA